MTKFLVTHFVKNYEETEKVSVRTAYGVMASVVGIFCNVLLFGAKAMIGLLLGSISVTADAFNNLSDAASSVIALVGVKMAGKPADKEHPFGHGRIEYIAALIVAFLVMQVGFQFFKDSIAKVREPEEIQFQFIAVLILGASVLVKVWLGIFNKTLGGRIDSKVMKATAADALGDVVITLTTIGSILFFKFTGWNIDGFVGIIVSFMVMWAGIGIAKDTLEPLIGEGVAPEEYVKISRFVQQYEGIEGSHDLIVHNYGPGRSMASIHAEVPNNVSIEESHEIIDCIERDARKKLGIFLVIHMDPIETRDEQVLKAKRQTEKIVSEIDVLASIHDFRLVDGKYQVNLIFDMMVPFHYGKEEEVYICKKLRDRLHEEDERYECVITIERSYIAGGMAEKEG